MNLKNELDKELKTLFYLTESLKQLESEIKDASAAVKKVYVEIIYEYKSVFNKVNDLLRDYICEARSQGIVPLTYIKLYREKFGENTYEQTIG